ncbi:MAG: hypothetical protein M1436_03955 [Acidobacteria bacterium]|nr:hypothetical protein [Acidobacteriota bacterium]
MNLDEELRSALRRVDPPEGFAARVLARVAAQGARKPRPWWRPALAWAAAASLMLAGIQYQHRRAERARGEAARREVMMALRIAAAKLHMAQSKVRQINRIEERKL